MRPVQNTAAHVAAGETADRLSRSATNARDNPARHSSTADAELLGPLVRDRVHLSREWNRLMERRLERRHLRDVRQLLAKRPHRGDAAICAVRLALLALPQGHHARRHRPGPAVFRGGRLRRSLSSGQSLEHGPGIVGLRHALCRLSTGRNAGSDRARADRVSGAALRAGRTCGRRARRFEAGGAGYLRQRFPAFAAADR